MRSAKIVRFVDKMGRVVIPKNLINDIFKENGEFAVEFFYDKDSIIIKKFKENCIFCQCEEELIDYKGIKICKNCLKNLKDI